MTLEEIISQLRLTSEIAQAVMQKIQSNMGHMEEIATSAYAGEAFHFNLCRRMPLTRLAVVTYLLKRQYDAYHALGIPDPIIFDTFRDVSLRATLYYRENGKAGLSREDVIWFRHIMHAEIFQIGALQFQPFSMVYLDEETIGEPYMSFTKAQKEALPSGTPVLNCHIQRGADLSPRAVQLSFQAAKQFFCTHFPSVAYKAFLCYSWLLYPPMVAQLPDHSNIRQFSSRFSILGACQDPKQAMENLFDANTNKEPSAQLTSLQKLAVNHPNLLGFACGIIRL